MNEYPTVNLPKAPVVAIRKPKQLAKRVSAEPVPSNEEPSFCTQGNNGEDPALPTTADIGVQTRERFDDYYWLKEEVSQLKARIESSRFRLSNMKLDDKRFSFIPDFQTTTHL